MKEYSKGYLVVITRKDGSRFFASGTQGRRFFSFKWSPANEFRRELNANGIKKAKVQRVVVTMELSNP